MHLKQLSLVNFKNYPEAEFEFSPQINCLVGNNGEGKTNLLDAIYYLSFCKSYFNPIDRQNIRHDEPFFVIQGTFDKEEKEEKVYCGLKRNQKKQFKRNKKEYSRLADHIGLFPLVMVSPYDSDLISEGSETRRKFIDSIIAQYDRVYLDNIISYNKVLSQRNALLKKFHEGRYFDPDSLEIWDVQLVDLGTKIHAARKTFLEAFIPVFQKHFDEISGGKETVHLEYKSQLNGGDFATLLAEAVEKDRVLHYSSLGTHKDDLLFKIGEFPIKKFGSQGQQKSYLIALKLAQFEHIKSIKKCTPILLLDDIFDKLDETRAQHLMELVSSNVFGQIFITDTHATRVPELFEHLDINLKRFTIQSGEVVV